MKVDLNEYNTVGSYVVLENCDNLPYNTAGWFFMNVYGGGNGGVVQEIINNYKNELDFSKDEIGQYEREIRLLSIKKKKNKLNCLYGSFFERFFI